MKNPQDLAKTIYLGDRGCKRIIIDGSRGALSIQVDRISRIRSPSGQWDFYADEDIVDGFIVFDGLERFEFQPQGLVPNDWIQFVDIAAGVSVGVREADGAGCSGQDPLHGEKTLRIGAIEPAPGTSRYVARLSLGAVDEDGHGKELELKVVFARLYLEDPLRPGLRLAD
jgi:hypothetical protein